MEVWGGGTGEEWSSGCVSLLSSSDLVDLFSSAEREMHNCDTHPAACLRYHEKTKFISHTIWTTGGQKGVCVCLTSKAGLWNGVHKMRLHISIDISHVQHPETESQTRYLVGGEGGR